MLGSGGASATPRAGNDHPVDIEAREKGVPYARTGPSTFIHGPNILFDTPVESRLQLVRAGVSHVTACFYSHWHPDHTMGRRVWESLNITGRGWPRSYRTSDVYPPEQVAEDFRTYLGGWDHLAFLESTGVIRVHEMKDGDSVTIESTTVTPIKLANGYVYAFLVEEGDSSVLIAMDETEGWQPSPELRARELDLAVLPIGVFEFHPLTGERRVSEDDPILEVEATFEVTLRIARSLKAREIVFSHIEALNEVGHDDLLLVAERLRADGLPVTIAWDGLRINLTRP